ncbi:hypothetical protein V6N11_031841 [Hibiscus sabdariffa]|uniref:GAG-pre-integrase domain-containing protein n=1 Tax=Hibiscus sabdariffa TaxID=183260 RepID=A0ABR2SZM4_9ROSI
MFLLPAIGLPNSHPLIPSCFQTTTEDIAHLWQCRFGHLNYKSLRLMQSERHIRISRVEENRNWDWSQISEATNKELGWEDIILEDDVSEDDVIVSNMDGAIDKNNLWRANLQHQT